MFIDKIHNNAKMMLNYSNMVNQIVSNGQNQSTIFPFSGGFYEQPRLFMKLIEAKCSHQLEEQETINIT